MTCTRFLLAAALATAAFGAAAQPYDAGPPKAASTQATPAKTRACPGYSTSPWATSYNQLCNFRSVQSRSQVQSQLGVGRQLALARQGRASWPGGPRLAGEPRNAY